MMRVTSSMLIQQLVQSVKNEGTAKPDIGKTIVANISEVLNGLLTLDLGNGTSVTAKDLTGRNYGVGQAVAFEVVGYEEGGTLQLRPTEGEPDLTAESRNFSMLLKRMGISDTVGNREVLRVLTAYRIPLNTENVKAALELTVQAKGIVQMASQAGTALLESMESEPLKQIANKLIEITTSQNTPPTIAPDAPLQKGMHPGGSLPVTVEVSGAPKAIVYETAGIAPEIPMENTVKVTEMPPGTAAKNPEQVINNEIEKLGVLEALPEAPEEIASNVKLPQGSESARGEELKELLKQLTMEKIGFILKNQLPGDFGTVSTLDKLILGKKELGVQLRELLVNLPEDAAAAPLRESIQAAVKSVHIHQQMNPFELQTQVKELNQTLSSLLSQVSESDPGGQRLKESLTEVRNSLDFLGKLSESATYLHVPVMLGQGAKPMDIYVQRDKSGRKKVNPHDTRIFISLDTNNLDTVQCLVEIKENKLNVGFKLCDQEALDIIGEYFAPLKESLTDLGYKDILIQGLVYQRPLNMLDITQESFADSRQIDLKV